MFVLTTTAKAVENSDDPFIGLVLLVTLIVSVVLLVKAMKH